MTPPTFPLKHLVFPCLLLLIGCGSRPRMGPKREVDLSSEPDFGFDESGPLDSATVRPELPLLRMPDGRFLDTCFETVKKPTQWQTADPKVYGALEQHREALDKLVIAWLKTEVFRDIGSDAAVHRHDLSLDTPVVRHVPDARLAFREDQTCLRGAARDFPMDADIVTALFGVKEIRGKSPRPLDRETVRKMKKAARQAGLRMTTENAYAPVLDGQGKPVKNEQGKSLFDSPSGRRITKKEIPPPKERMVVTWKLISQKPIFLAYGTASRSGWRKTPAEPPHCEVFLVFDDVKPRVPVCTTFDQAGFGATRSDSPDEVVVRIATAHRTVTPSLPYNTPSMVVADDKLIVWITPAPVEEGIKLRVDALWLDTGEGSPKIDAFDKKGKKVTPSKKRRPEKGGDKPIPPPLGY